MGEDDDPLPDTDEPHVLLGVPLDADEKSIRRAYAQRIKRWRPDRSPAEFNRIHRAFEQALQPGTAVPELATTAATPTPDDEHADVERRAFAAAQALATARADSDLTLIDQVLARACADGIPIGALFEFTPPDLHATMVNSPALTWSRISANGGPGYAAETLESVLAVSLRMRFQTRAYALLRDPVLVRAAATDPSLAAICLKAIAALAWMNRPPAAANARAWFLVLPADEAISALARRVDLEIATGGRCTVPGLGIPGPLLECFALAPSLPYPIYRDVLRQLADDVRTRTSSYLEAFDRVLLVPELETFLSARLEADTPGGAERVVPDDALARMARQLLAGSGRLGPRLAVGGVAAAGLAAMALPPLSVPELLPLPIVAGGVIIGFMEKGRYRHVRRELATLIAETGVPASAVARWVAEAGSLRSPRYGRFWRCSGGSR